MSYYSFGYLQQQKYHQTPIMIPYNTDFYWAYRKLDIPDSITRPVEDEDDFSQPNSANVDICRDLGIVKVNCLQQSINHSIN